MDFERRNYMGQLLEEYGGSLLAFITGAFIIGAMLAMGEDGGILYQFVVTYCGSAV